MGRAFAVLMMTVLVAVAGPTQAQTSVQQDLIDRAALAVSAVRRDGNIGPALDAALATARGVVIIPNLIKGGFILGGEGGNGVMLGRLPDGSWSAPAFISMGGASIGLQIGGTISEVVFTVMTDGGMNAVLVNKVKLGADAAVAVGPVGLNVEASTTTAIGADIYSYAKSQGLFGGGAFEGSVIAQRDTWNLAYYGSDMQPRRIVTDATLISAGAEKLRAALATN